MNNSDCKTYAMPKYEQKYCSGKQMVNQDTCQVSFNLFYEIISHAIFQFLSFLILKGDSGGGQYCRKLDGKWYSAG